MNTESTVEGFDPTLYKVQKFNIDEESEPDEDLGSE